MVCWAGGAIARALDGGDTGLIPRRCLWRSAVLTPSLEVAGAVRPNQRHHVLNEGDLIVRDRVEPVRARSASTSKRTACLSSQARRERSFVQWTTYVRS